jgi:hypothetical protein
MAGTSDPNIIVGALASSGLAFVFLWRLLVRFRESPKTPDPWGEEIEKQLHEPDAVEICHHCFTPRSLSGWFCEHCGSAVGPYNNMMPFVNVFSEGEIFRNGVNDKLRASPFIIIGYLLFSLSAYAFFAPIYWFFFFKNLKRLKDDRLKESKITSPDSRP